MDFERMWIEKLKAALERVAEPGMTEELLHGSGDLSQDEIISWTAAMVEKLNELLPPDRVNEIITSCACHYPLAKLVPIRDAFRENHDFAQAISMLNEQFTRMLEQTHGFHEETVEMLLSDGMGPAGVLENDRIVATKIPKSGNLRAWLSEDDLQSRRELYCHCPRVRDAVKLNLSVPVEYCLCGAGFYRNIWEEITEQPVRVEMLKSVMTGDHVCSIAIYPSAMKA